MYNKIVGKQKGIAVAQNSDINPNVVGPLEMCINKYWDISTNGNNIIKKDRPKVFYNNVKDKILLK